MLEREIYINPNELPTTNQMSVASGEGFADRRPVDNPRRKAIENALFSTDFALSKGVQSKIEKA